MRDEMGRPMKNLRQGSLFDEPSESKRWHRIHASPASGRGGCSLDTGPVRWRGEGGLIRQVFRMTLAS